MRSCPKGRKRGLIFEQLDDGETLVYERESHRAHALSPVASRVLRHCDGRASVEQIAGRVSRELPQPMDGAAVDYVLGRLEAARLIEPRKPRAQPMKRREVSRVLALCGGAVLVSILAPDAAVAATGCAAANKCTPTNETACCGDGGTVCGGGGTCVCQAGECRCTTTPFQLCT